ncbi:MAG: hypothetical protein WAM69_08695 [Candidatus Sulfotelmatobacter sp.]
MLSHVPKILPPTHRYQKPPLRKKAVPMTAIAAFVCSDGLVMAADTEETYPENKVYTFKLFPFEREGKRLCVAGSGIGYLIDYAKDEIASALDSGIANVADFEKRLREIMQKLYRSDFKLYPADRDSDRQIQLLVGAQFVDESNSSTWLAPSLFECQSNLVTVPKNPAQRARILGAGEVLQETARQFSNWGLNVELAERVCLYIMYEAKRRIAGVGGKTHIFTMRNDGRHGYYRGKHIGEEESVLAGFNGITQLLLFALEPSVTDRKANDFINTAKKWLKGARRYLTKVEQGKIVNPTVITMQNAEISKLMRRLRSIKPLASETSEPEP